MRLLQSYLHRLRRRHLATLVGVVVLVTAVVEFYSSKPQAMPVSHTIVLAPSPATVAPQVASTSTPATDTTAPGQQAGSQEPQDFDFQTDDELPLPKPTGAHNTAPTLDWSSYTVQGGDSFSAILSSWSQPYTVAQEILKAAPSADLVEKLNPGDELDYKIDGSGDLVALRIRDGLRVNYIFTRQTDGQYHYEKIEKPVERYQEYFAGTVDGTLGASARKAGLDSKVIAQCIHILGNRIDFARDVRKGDTFTVVVERDWLGDTPTQDVRILLVEYHGKRKQVVAMRADDGHYYTPTGNSLELAFMRYPFYHHYRLTSPFNLHRLNPVTHRYAPHYGTDFGMPVGSHIYAPADGVVVKTGHQRYAGNYVAVQHGRYFMTRYFHLSKILVHRGEKVKMGQVLALSGNTGRTTGPHLHYELLYQGHPVNAMTASLPRHRQLRGTALAKFEANAKVLLAEAHQNSTQLLASNSHGYIRQRIQ